MATQVDRRMMKSTTQRGMYTLKYMLIIASCNRHRPLYLEQSGMSQISWLYLGVRVAPWVMKESELGRSTGQPPSSATGHVVIDACAAVTSGRHTRHCRD